MVTVYISEREDFPVFDLTLEPDTEAVSCEVDPALVDRYHAAVNEYEAVQESLKELYWQQRWKRVDRH